MINQTNHILLSLAIPTYNRPKQIIRLLKGVLPQITPEIEVVVRDDSSNNETEKAVKEIFAQANKIPNLSYYKGDKLGVDLGTLFVVEAAKGEYVWTFGDDDEITGGALKHVADLVKKHPEITFLWANYLSDGGPYSAVRMSSDKFFKDRNQVLEELKNEMTLLSTFIFKKDEAMSAMPLAKKYAGSYWSIIVLILEVLSKNGRFYFLKGPYVLNNLEPHGEADFYGGFQVFGVNLFQVFEEFKGKFNKKSIRVFFTKHFGQVWRGVLVNRARYPVSIIKSGILAKISKLYWNYPEYWIALPFLLMPRFMLVSFYRVYKIFFSHRKFIFNKSLKSLLK